MVGNSFADIFFKYITYLGDGVFAICISLIILFFNIRNGILIFVSYALSGLITSGMKNYFFDNVYRPFFVIDYFRGDLKLKLVDGVAMIGQNSFPSGHATTAFAVFTAMALMSDKGYMKIIFLFTATLVAFSRTYLSQHWLVDIYFGSLIGLTSAMVLYFVVIKLEKLNRPLLLKRN